MCDIEFGENALLSKKTCMPKENVLNASLRELLDIRGLKFFNQMSLLDAYVDWL